MPPAGAGYAGGRAVLAEDRREMKDLDYYESLPYHAVWEHVATPGGDWYWRVHLQEIPAVSGMGATEDEALGDLRERFEEYVRFRLDLGLDIPEPRTLAGRSGNGRGPARDRDGDGFGEGAV